MTDTERARELAIELREMHSMTVCGEAWQELELDLDQSAALILAALQAVREREQGSSAKAYLYTPGEDWKLLSAVKAEIIAAEREAAADRLRARFDEQLHNKNIDIDSLCSSVLAIQSASPKEGESAQEEITRMIQTGHFLGPNHSLDAGNMVAAPLQEGQSESVQGLLTLIDKAHGIVVALCHGERWTMHVPAQPDSDPDLVIGRALREAKAYILAHTEPATPLQEARDRVDAEIARCERDKILDKTPAGAYVRGLRFARAALAAEGKA